MLHYGSNPHSSQALDTARSSSCSVKVHQGKVKQKASKISLSRWQLFNKKIQRKQLKQSYIVQHSLFNLSHAVSTSWTE